MRDERSTWLTRPEFEAFAPAMCQQGYRVPLDLLLDSLTDGAFVGRVVVLSLVVSKAFSQERASGVVERAIGEVGKA